MLAREGVSERGCGKERLASTVSALSSTLFLPGSGIFLELVPLQAWHLLGLWGFRLVSPCLQSMHVYLLSHLPSSYLCILKCKFHLLTK